MSDNAFASIEARLADCPLFHNLETNQNSRVVKNDQMLTRQRELLFFSMYRDLVC